MCMCREFHTLGAAMGKAQEEITEVAGRDVVLGTCTRVQLEYRFQVLVLVLVLEG